MQGAKKKYYWDRELSKRKYQENPKQKYGKNKYAYNHQ